MACEYQCDAVIPARTSDRCVYVGKGPTAREAIEHANWGDVVCVNEAANIKELNVRIAICDGVRKASDISLDVPLVVAPKRIFADPEWQGRNVFAWESEAEVPKAHGNIDRAIQSRETKYFSCPAPSGILFLWLMGYQKFWLFGHDGGSDILPEWDYTVHSPGTDYTGRRELIEYMALVLGKHGVEIIFYPDIPDEAEPCTNN